MRTYLVGTHSFLLAVEFDDDWSVRGHHVLNQGHHYGLAVFDNGERTILAKRPESSGREVLLFDAAVPFARKGLLQLDDIGKSHQMTVANGGLYVANTQYNSVVYQQLDGDVRHEFFVGGVRHDRNHVNSVYPCGDQVYVLLHNSFRRVSQMLVLRHDLEHGFRREHVLSLWNEGCHNIFVDGEKLYYNSSQTGEFVAVDLASERVERRLRYPEAKDDGKVVLNTHGHHTKGLSATERHFVIGFSEYASRRARRQTKSYLAVIDRGTLTTSAVIDLNFPGLGQPAGNVNEVRCLSEPEKAQGRQSALDVDWSSLRLARRDTLAYARTNLFVLGRNLGKVGKKLAERVLPDRNVLGE